MGDLIITKVAISVDNVIKLGPTEGHKKLSGKRRNRAVCNTKKWEFDLKDINDEMT
ncbi:MAG: hypothetical protein QXU18_09595 [Thermoplasmatales archaeon]